jgi:hypothetical protein
VPASAGALALVNASFSQAPFFDVAASSAYTMTTADGFEMLVSFAGVFTEDNPLREDAPAVQNPRFALILFITGAEAEELNSEGEIGGLEGIGETARGYYGLATRKGQPVRVDLVVFNRGRAGVYVFHLYPDRGVAGGAVTPLARLLDVRLLAAQR